MEWSISEPFFVRLLVYFNRTILFLEYNIPRMESLFNKTFNTLNHYFSLVEVPHQLYSVVRSSVKFYCFESENPANLHSI